MTGRRHYKNIKTSKAQHTKSKERSDKTDNAHSRHGVGGNPEPQSSGSLRIADVDFMFSQFQGLEQHSDKGCGVFHFEVTDHTIEGGKFGWLMECRKCHFKKTIFAEENEGRNREVLRGET